MENNGRTLKDIFLGDEFDYMLENLYISANCIDDWMEGGIIDEEAVLCVAQLLTMLHKKIQYK